MSGVIRLLHFSQNLEIQKKVNNLLFDEFENISLEVVGNKDDFCSAVSSNNFDIILCDNPNNCNFTIKMLTSKTAPLPVIIISEHVDEETVADIMLDGVFDYVPIDNLRRLVPSVKRAIAKIKNIGSNNIKDILNVNCDFYKIVVNQIPSVIIVHKEQRIVFINQSGVELYGYKEEEIYGHSIFDFIDDESKKLVETNLKKRMLGEEIQDYEISAFTKNKQKHTLLVKAIPINYGDGNAILAIMTNISIRKQEEENNLLNEERLQSLLNITQIKTNSTQELLDYTLNEAVKLTRSKIGYIYHYNEDKRQFILNSWSKDVMKECSIMEIQTVYELDKTGLWGEAVRQRKPIVVNDFQAPNPLKKGYPEGHVALHRFLTIPLINNNCIVAVAGVGNKDTDYNDADVRQLSLLIDSVWKIIDQKEIETALRNSEEKFSKAFRNSPDLYIITTIKDGTISEVNDTFCRITGFSEDECKGKTTVEINIWNSIQDRKTYIENVLKYGKVQNFESVLRKKDGSLLTCLLSGELIRINQEDFVLNVLHDISERKKIEDALIESEERFKTIYENANDAIMLLDAESFFHCNSKTLEIFGLNSIQEFINLHPADLSPKLQPNGRNSYEEAKKRIEFAYLNGTNRFEWTHRRSNGDEFAAEVMLSVFNLQGKKVLQATLRDITEQKRAEIAIKESEEKYRSLFENSNDPIFIHVDGLILEVNQKACELLGYDKTQFINLNILDLIPNEEKNKYTEKHNDVCKTGSVRFESMFNKQTGETINVDISASIIDTSINIVQVIARDITDYKRAINEISVNKVKLQILNEDLEKRVFERTAKLEEAYNEIIISNERLNNTIIELKQTQSQLIQSEKMVSLGQLISGIAHEINSPLGAIKSQNEFINNDIDVLLTELPTIIRELPENIFNLIIQVIGTALSNNQILTTKEEHQLKMMILDRLTALNISNPLKTASILSKIGSLDIIQEIQPILRYKNSEKVLEMTNTLIELKKGAEIIHSAVSSIMKIVFALRNFAHDDVLNQPIKYNIAQGIDTVLVLYYNKIKQGVALTKDFQFNEEIFCYPDELNQVWTNIIHNALQAMDFKGELHIQLYQKNEYVVISFKDTGKGIPDNLHDKIFEPFFTTKPLGEGTGLGLDIVSRIIQKHNGKISFISQINVGTTFIIEIPKNLKEEKINV